MKDCNLGGIQMRRIRKKVFFNKYSDNLEDGIKYLREILHTQYLETVGVVAEENEDSFLGRIKKLSTKRTLLSERFFLKTIQTERSLKSR